MSSYKDFSKIFIGASDYAVLVAAMPGREKLTRDLSFGADGGYYAYLVPKTAEIDEHYNLVDSGVDWLKIYDDNGLVFYAKAETIEIYRAGVYGCVIRLGDNADILLTANGVKDNEYHFERLIEPQGLSIKELMEKSGRGKSVIYKLAKELGRLPTLEELEGRPNGRPKKYK